MISHGTLQILPLNCTKFLFSGHFEIKQRSRKSAFYANSGREMVRENQEIVMEKSWTNILSSLWEP